MGPPPSPHPDTAKELLHVQQENTEHHLNIRGFPWLYHPTKWQSPLLVPGAPKSIAWQILLKKRWVQGKFRPCVGMVSHQK